jgi:hypothetical protein
MKMFDRTHAFHSSKGRSKGVRICRSLATAIFITCCFTSLAPAVSISLNQSSIVFPDTLVGSSSSVETFTATVQDLGPLFILGWSASVVSPTDFNFLGFGLGCVTSPRNPCTTDFAFTPQSAGLHDFTFRMTAVLSDSNFVQTTDLSVSGTGINATPLPAALPLFASGLGALGLLGWRRKRKAAA